MYTTNHVEWGLKVIRTRRASVKDLETINKLTYEMHHFLGSLVGIKFTMKQLKDEMYENEEDIKNVYVGESDGKVVGYMDFSQDICENEFFGRYYHLYHLVVQREFRKRVASRLFNMLLRKARRENVNIVTEAFCLNREGLEFYRKAGFKPIENVLIIDNTKKLKLSAGTA
jgi:GNAT superfamily N-acetyltransferase